MKALTTEEPKLVFDDLPADILKKIAYFLFLTLDNPKDFLNFLLACRKAYEIGRYTLSSRQALLGKYPLINEIKDVFFSEDCIRRSLSSTRLIDKDSSITRRLIHRKILLTLIRYTDNFDWNDDKLMSVIKGNNLLMVIAALSSNKPLNLWVTSKYYQRETALIAAILKKNVPMVKLLLKSKACSNQGDLSRSEIDEVFPLLVAMLVGDNVSYELLLKHGAELKDSIFLPLQNRLSRQDGSVLEVDDNTKLSMAKLIVAFAAGESDQVKDSLGNRPISLNYFLTTMPNWKNFGKKISPLSLAIRNNQAGVLRYIFERAEIFSNLTLYFKIMIGVIIEDKESFRKRLKELKASKNILEHYKFNTLTSAMKKAIEFEKKVMLEVILEEFDDTDLFYKSLGELICHALWHNKEEFIEFLLSYRPVKFENLAIHEDYIEKAKQVSISKCGLNPIINAIRFKTRIDIIKKLLEYGFPYRYVGAYTDSNAKEFSFSNVPKSIDIYAPDALCTAVLVGYADAVELLVSSYGISLQSIYRSTPEDIHYTLAMIAATNVYDPYMLEFLHKRGANINLAVDDGKTSLMVACQLGDDNLANIKFLLKNAADVNARCYLKYRYGVGPRLYVRRVLESEATALDVLTLVDQDRIKTTDAEALLVQRNAKQAHEVQTLFSSVRTLFNFNQNAKRWLGVAEPPLPVIDPPRCNI